MNTANVILIIILFALIVTCNQPKNDPPFVLPFAFDRQKWQEDTLACNGYRENIIYNITKHEEYFLYKVSMDTFLHYFGDYYDTSLYNETKYYYYWVENGYHCRINLNDAHKYRLAVENEPFFAVIVRRKDNKISNFILGE